MQRNTKYLLALTLLLPMFAGCAGKQKTPESTGSNYSQCPKPDWVDAPQCEAGLCAVGIGKSQDYGFARTTAEADGREKLVQMLATDVRNLFERLVEENQALTKTGSSSGFSFDQNTSQQLAAETISGARPLSYYDDCVHGHVAALMVLTPDDVVRQMKRTMAKAIQASHDLHRAKKDAATAKMNALIDERYKGKHGAEAAPMP